MITIMVLELKPPLQPSFAALLPLWPTGLSYAVSYLFIAIVWVNHHHLLRFAEHAMATHERVRSLVYIAALAPDEGETVAQVYSIGKNLIRRLHICSPTRTG